jgi:hypothetical protein
MRRDPQPIELPFENITKVNFTNMRAFIFGQSKVVLVSRDINLSENVDVYN